MREFLIRTASAVVFAAVVLAALFLGKDYAFVVFVFFMAAILYEVGNIFHFKNKLSTVIYVLLGILFCFAATFGTKQFTVHQWGALIILFLISALSVLNIGKSNYPSFFVKIALFFYVCVPFILFLSLFNFSLIVQQNEFFFPLVFLIFIWIGDTFAYLSGRLFGKHKMVPKISPAKTWEGFIGGFAAVLIAAAVVWYVARVQNVVFWLVFACITYCFGVCGDLIESKLKRKANTKDSGKLIPGHGGAFDRFDSFIFALPFVVLLLLYYYL